MFPFRNGKWRNKMNIHEVVIDVLHVRFLLLTSTAYRFCFLKCPLPIKSHLTCFIPFTLAIKGETSNHSLSDFWIVVYCAV